MTILLAACDICNIELKPVEICHGYDGEHLCKICNAKKLLKELQDDYNEKKKWLEETHLAELNGINDQIQNCKTNLARMIQEKEVNP